jgi:hypothetical protein
MCSQVNRFQQILDCTAHRLIIVDNRYKFGGFDSVHIGNLTGLHESGAITPWYYGYGWALRREAQALEARNALAVGCAAALSDGLSQPCSLAIFLPEGSPRFAAILTNSAKDSAFIFLIARPRWILSIMTPCETLTRESSW